MTRDLDSLKALSPGDLERVENALQQVKAFRQSGRVKWLCDRPDCDGRPHAGRPGPHARAAQRPPTGRYHVWMALAGRGWGKTRTGAEYVIDKARTQERGALIGPTAADVRDTMVEGESGILACAPPLFRPEYQPSKRRLVYPNGAIQACYSADEPDRLRGPQHHYGWFDEMAAWRYIQYAWDMAQLGMRLGTAPQVCVTTTPRPLPLIKELMAKETTVVSSGSTYDNLHNLAETFKQAVLDKYEGTTLGRQELMAEILQDLPGALVRRHLIDQARITPDALPELVSLVVGLDPAGTSTGDETGLVVTGWDADRHHYVLEDATRRRTPDETARSAYALLEKHGARRIVVEDNGGKDWIEDVLQRVWRDIHGEDAGPAPIERVNASQGKKLRAQPTAMLYEQGRIHHVGVFATLEDQLTTWIPEEDRNSPDHLDALVHAVTYHLKRDRMRAAAVNPHKAQRKGSGGGHPATTARRARQTVGAA